MIASDAAPILQFGTSRFLQAHVDLFVSDALVRGEALGKITVVQTTGNPDSARRVAALASGKAYPVKVQGIQDGREVDEVHWSSSVQRAVHAESEWASLRQLFTDDIQVVISNTGDSGYRLDHLDNASLLAPDSPTPRSFPAKLLVLLHGRWSEKPMAAISLFPCELVVRNGDVLRDLIVALAAEWNLDQAFIRYLSKTCLWANSLVDRIVSEPIQPIGAVAEPYALWAIERQAGLTLPCSHPAVVLTDDLEQFEQLKLFLLNLGHSYLAERWLGEGRAQDETVHHAMTDPVLRADLEGVWAQEVLPVFSALGKSEIAQAYLATVKDRLLNPFLQHRIVDIAQNHEEKKRRRILPLIKLAAQVCPELVQPRLHEALSSGHSVTLA
ncbi:mannitol dehydrogenase family protein [Pseudomonas sp. Pseusp122]|uniref:mannitol dehydrogenase family protein n=1 Tax=unclassified Pseudomonas TaxID=196821 RepID=UPI0039A6B5EF